jgi:uncharacterized protein YbjQ (UPF0145 family)
MAGFFSNEASDEEGAAPCSQDTESLRRIESGGIPLATERRLQGLAREGSMFLGEISPAELGLLEGLGQRPLAQVMGASVYQVGWQYLPALDARLNPARGMLDSAYLEPSFTQKRSYLWEQTVVYELDTITRAWDQARRHALDRLSEEAAQVKADAVVGVRLRRGEHDWGERTIDYVVSGTAIRWQATPSGRWPLLSDLGVQDYWRLLHAGYEPVGLLATTAVIFVSASRSVRLQRVRSTFENQELEELSRAFHVARDTVRARLQGQVDANNGTGAVGVELSHSVHEGEFSLENPMRVATRPGWQQGQVGLPTYVKGGSEVERSGWVITMHGSGTAIRRRADGSSYPPETTVRLNSSRAAQRVPQ